MEGAVNNSFSFGPGESEKQDAATSFMQVRAGTKTKHGMVDKLVTKYLFPESSSKLLSFFLSILKEPHFFGWRELALSPFVDHQHHYCFDHEGHYLKKQDTPH